MSLAKITKAVIPAAGLGTRFLPATKASPKEMLPLFDKPLIQYVIEEAVASGIQQIIVITGRGKRAVEDHFDISFELEETLKHDGKKELSDVLRKISNLAEFCYIRQKEPRGLGHAVLCAKPWVGDEPFAVLLADEIIDHPQSALQQMVAVYERYAFPVIGVQRVPMPDVRQYGIIRGKPFDQSGIVAGTMTGIGAEIAGLYQLEDLIEKPSPEEAPSDIAVVGRYILTPEIFSFLEKTKPGKNNEIQLTDALREMARHAPMLGLTLKGERFDAGDRLGFLKANIEMALKNQEIEKALRLYLKKVVSRPPQQEA